MARAEIDQQAATAQIKSMTGGQVKLAWCRTVNGAIDYLGCVFKDQQRAIWQIVVFDTEEGRERVFAPASTPDTYCIPLITPNGKRLIWSRGRTDVMIADWNGHNAHLLCKGLHAMAVAEDPPGTEWVYVADDEDGHGSPKSIYRYQIDNPSVKEVAWNKTTIGCRLEVSRDGKWAVGEWNGNACGLASFPNGGLKTFGQGCNTGMAFDSGMHVWHMLGGHRGIQMYDNGGANGHFISLDGAPGRNGELVEWWSPSGMHWDGRFFTFSGPWKGPHNDHGNVIVAQWGEDYRSIKQFVRVTDVPQSELYLYGWIGAPGAGSESDAAPSIASGLEVKLLTGYVKRLDRGNAVKPIRDELERMSQEANADRAKEAQALCARIDEWQQDQLQQAKGLETKDPAAADKAYKNLAARCAGMDSAKTARDRLADKTFEADLRAWGQYQRMVIAEKRLKDVPGAEHSAADPKFARPNEEVLSQIKSLGQGLSRQGPSPWIVAQANAILESCGLEKLQVAGGSGQNQ